MFADDIGLLPEHMFTRILRHARPAQERFVELAGELFEVMATGGRGGLRDGGLGFNGGLFDDSTVLPLEKPDIETVLSASDQPLCPTAPLGHQSTSCTRTVATRSPDTNGQSGLAF